MWKPLQRHLIRAESEIFASSAVPSDDDARHQSSSNSPNKTNIPAPPFGSYSNVDTNVSVPVSPQSVQVLHVLTFFRATSRSPIFGGPRALAVALISHYLPSLSPCRLCL